MLCSRSRKTLNILSSLGSNSDGFWNFRYLIFTSWSAACVHIKVLNLLVYQASKLYLYERELFVQSVGSLLSAFSLIALFFVTNFRKERLLLRNILSKSLK